MQHQLTLTRTDYRLLAFATALALILAQSLFFGVKVARATDVSDASDTMTRQQISTASSHDIQFTLSASETFATTETIILDFNEDSSGFTLDGASVAIADIDFNDGTERTIVGVDGDCTGHSGANDVAITVADATGIITVTACGSYTASSANATVNLEIGTVAGGSNRLTNPSSAGAQEVNVSGTFGDDAFDIDVPILDGDQVSITASVDTSISFDIDVSDGHGDSNAAYSLALGELAFSAITDETTSGVSEIYIDLTTNADDGAIVQVQSANAALSSSSASDSISSADATIAANTTDGGYGAAAIQEAAATEGTLTPVSPYNVHGTTGGVGGLSTVFQTIFNTGTAPIVDGDGEVAIRAVAGKSTAAADDYTDTLTFIATATY